MDPQTGFSLVNSAQPPIQQQGNAVQLNCTLTIPESMLVAFIKKMIQVALDQDNTLMYIGISEPMQKSFNEYVAKTFSTANFSGEQLRLAPLVASVWQKTKITVENELHIKNDAVAAQDESTWHSIASTELETLRAQGHTGGKLFTVRQAKFILKI